METKQRSSQSFCARPGCGLAKSGHGFLAGACSNFIQPGSKEANEAKKAHLSVVETPVPEVIEDEPATAKVRTPSDAELMTEWRARAASLVVLA
jgi:hypothetical protein